MRPRRTTLGMTLAAGAAVGVTSLTLLTTGVAYAATFNAPVVVSGADDTEPGIDVAPDGTLYINAPVSLLSSLPGSPSDVFRSTDSGTTWSKLPASLKAEFPGGGDSDIAIGADGSLAETDLWLGSSTVASSTDKGQTWLANPLQGVVTSLALGTDAPTTPLPANASSLNLFWDHWIRYFVAGDPGHNALAVDPQNLGALQARVSALSSLLDVNQTAFSAFASKGGKLLIAHGTADVLVSTRATEQYFERLQAAMGEAKVREFARFYGKRQCFSGIFAQRTRGLGQRLNEGLWTEALPSSLLFGQYLMHKRHRD